MVRLVVTTDEQLIGDGAKKAGLGCSGEAHDVQRHGVAETLSLIGATDEDYGQLERQQVADETCGAAR